MEDSSEDFKAKLLVYSEKEISKIREVGYFKNSDKSTDKYKEITFRFSDFDPNFILLKEKEEYFFIILITINNQPLVNTTYYKSGGIKEVSIFQDRLVLGNWQLKYLTSGIRIHKLLQYIISQLNESKPKQNYTTAFKGNKQALIQKPNEEIKTMQIPELETEAPKLDGEDIYLDTDIPALFNGAENIEDNQKKMKMYFEQKKKENPVTARGTIYLQFVIDKTGKPKNVKILRGASNKLNKLAIKFIEEMPNWSPASNNGSNVNYVISTQVNF